MGDEDPNKIPAEVAEHRLVGDWGVEGCSQGDWKPRLGESIRRSFDKHLLEVKHGETKQG